MKHLWDYQINDCLPEREWHPSDLQLRQYAEASGDFNPIHLDDRYAQALGFGGTIVHGMLIMAQMGAMLSEWMGQEGILKTFKVRFNNTVRSGERVVCSVYIKDICATDLVCDLVAIKANGNKVLSGQAVVSLRTAPESND